MQLPLYEVLPISALRGDQLQHVALVSHPANGLPLLGAGPEEPLQLAARHEFHDAGMRLITGVLLVPGQPILRRNHHNGQSHYLLFTDEAIASIAAELTAAAPHQPLTDEHARPLPGQIIKVWLSAPGELSIGKTRLPAGCLVCQIHLDDEAFWRSSVVERAGRGLSLAGQFSVRAAGLLHHDENPNLLAIMKQDHALPEALGLMQEAWQRVLNSLRPKRQAVQMSAEAIRQESPEPAAETPPEPVASPSQSIDNQQEPVAEFPAELQNVTEEQLQAELDAHPLPDRGALQQQVEAQTNRLRETLLRQLSELYVSRQENEQLRERIGQLENRLQSLGDQAPPLPPLPQAEAGLAAASRSAHIMQGLRRLQLI